MWLFYALLAGGLYTVVGLLTRHVLKGQKDAWAFSFYFSLIGAVVSFPFMLAAPVLPKSIGPWLLALLVGFLIVGYNLLNFKVSNYIEVSLSGAIMKIRLVWIFVLSLLFLGVGFSWQQILGTLITVAAGVVIIRKFHPVQGATR
jgi:drug/metabolite transporter (DMT)-like permease